jgi:hypothetical protein
MREQRRLRSQTYSPTQVNVHGTNSFANKCIHISDHLRFEVLTAAKIWTRVFWVVIIQVITTISEGYTAYVIGVAPRVPVGG